MKPRIGLRSLFVMFWAIYAYDNKAAFTFTLLIQETCPYFQNK